MAVKRTLTGRSSPRPGGRKKSKAAPQGAPRGTNAVRPGFLTDESLEVLEFLGDTSRYLHLAPGKAGLSLQKILAPLLYREVRDAIRNTATAKVVKRSGVSLLLGGIQRIINIEVSRLTAGARGGTRYRILLEDAGPVPRQRAKTGPAAKAARTGRTAASRLKVELGSAKESFRDILAEQEQKHELALGQLAAAREDSKAFAAELEVINTELEASHAELEATAAELKVALVESESRQERLEESEGRVRALLETAAQGILAVERNGRIGMVNRTAETMFGYSREELLGQPVEMLLPEGLRSIHRRHRLEFFAQPRTRPMGQGLDLFARRKDGTTFPVEISLSHIDPEDGMVAVAFISDITERKRAVEARWDSEERFRLAAQCGNDLIYEWDLDTNELQWWGNVDAFLGHRPETLAIFEKWIHPKDRAGVMAAVETHLRTGEPFARVYRIKAKNGTYRYWQDQGIARRDEQGKPKKWIGACTDITERRRAEALLRLQAEITANMAEGVAMVRARDAVIVYASERFHKLFGYDPGELHGKPVTVLNAGTKAEAKATAREIIRALNRDSQWKGEIRNIRKDGSLFWSSTVVTTLEHDEFGTVWLNVLRDVTERRAAQDALRTSHAELRALTSRLTAIQEEEYKHLSRELHDVFSQKLTMLGMRVGELERELSAAGLASAADAGQAGAQISGLAIEIHDISRRLHPAILDDLGLAAALENECLSFSREHGYEATFRTRGSDKAIPGDVALCLYRVAQESLTNIRKHARTDRVEMLLSIAPGEAVLTIEDFGRGFDPNEVRGKGGLGLVSMEERIRLVAGQLTIRSNPGDGTIVEVRAPLNKARGKKSTGRRSRQ